MTNSQWRKLLLMARPPVQPEKKTKTPLKTPKDGKQPLPEEDISSTLDAKRMKEATTAPSLQTDKKDDSRPASDHNSSKAKRKSNVQKASF